MVDFSASSPTGTGSYPSRHVNAPSAVVGSGPPVTYLSRKFVARRISEGETGRLKEELKCQECGKGYKHISSLAKHLWEHTPEWNMTSKLLISKHQQVQLLEAASILVSMNEEDEDETPDKAPEAAIANGAKQPLQTNNTRNSVSHSTNVPGTFQHKEHENVPLKSPSSSPSLINDSSTPSPPPQPLTPQYIGSTQPLKLKEHGSQAFNSNLMKPNRIHSRSSSLNTNSLYSSSPTASSITTITDSLYPVMSSSVNNNSHDVLLSSSLSGTNSSFTRYDDVLSADSLSKRNFPHLKEHPIKSRRLSSLNPPPRVNTRVVLDSDDDDDHENAVVDDLDDGVFGDMD